MKKVLAMVLAMLLLASSCAVSFAAEDERSRSCVIAIAENNSIVDPLKASTMLANMMFECYLEGLVKCNHDGTFTPLLAESWDFSEDGRTCYFHLREGITFHNGEVFNADDVVGVYQRLLDNKDTLAVATSNWSTLTGIEKVDDYTVGITTSEPYATILKAVAYTYIYGNEAYEEMGEDLWNKQLMTGTGAWIFQELVDGQYVRFVKNENYWGKEEYDSYFNELTLRFILEPSTAIAAHLSGDIDAYIAPGGINSDMLRLYEGTDDRIDLIQQENAGFQFFGFNCAENRPFHDKNVREAFMLAIDGETIAATLYGGGAKNVGGLITAGLPGYDESLEAYPYDPEKAAELLANSSYDGYEIELSSHTSTLNAEPMLLAVADYLSAVGFNCRVKVVENVVLSEMRATGDYDVFMVTSMHDGGDPVQILTQRVLLDTQHTSYKNEELNNLIALSNAQLDAETRNDTLMQVGKIIHDETAPFGQLLQLIGTHAVDKGIVDLGLHKDGLLGIMRVNYDPSAA